jgi:hypothetical protein
MKRLGTYTMSGVGLLSGLIGIWVAPRSFWDWWWPEPAVLLLVVVVLAESAYLLVTRRAPPAPASHDQDNIHELLRMFPRETVNEWRDTDLLGGWPYWITDDLGALARRDEIEDRFIDPAIEQRRARLHDAARRLALLDAELGVPARLNGEWRDVGYSAGQLDSMMGTEEGTRASQHARNLEAAAEAMAEAYEALVDLARTRGYDVSAARGISSSRARLQTASDGSSS